MSFFFGVTKTEQAKKPATAPKRSGPIPIKSLNQLGCSVCPRNDDKTLLHPKMQPTGSRSPDLYVLVAAPSLPDDDKDDYLTDRAGRAVMRRLPRDMTAVRFNGVINCGSDTQSIGQHEMECCRSRVVQDIEESQPLVIMGVGDAPLRWATGMAGNVANALRFRNQFIAVKIGNHRCWYYPVIYPNFVYKRQSKPSPHEGAFDHDINTLLEMIDRRELPPPPDVVTSGFDDGIKIITGDHGTADLNALQTELEWQARQPYTGLDIESTGLRPHPAGMKLLTAAVCTLERGVAFPLDFPGNQWGGGWDSDRLRLRAWDLFLEFLHTSGIKECHNLAMEMEWLGFFTSQRILRMTQWADTMAMAYAMNPRRGTNSLAAQTVINFGFDIKAMSPVDVTQPDWWKRYPLKHILRYNGMDSKWTNALGRVKRAQLAETPHAQAAYDRLIRLAPTLAQMDLRGMPVSIKKAQALADQFTSQLAVIRKKIDKTPEVQTYRDRFGHFDPGNSNHVLKLMDEVLQRPEVFKEDPRTGAVSKSTDEEVLLSMPKRKVPSASLILEDRSLTKLMGTYLEPVISGRLVAPDGRMHAKYSSMVALTWRLAAEDPNSQNWPKRKHKEVRGVVTVEGTDIWILACDYGQIEFRVAGMLSEDENLVKACWTGYDVHTAWAKRMVELHPKIKDWIVSEFNVDWDEKGMKTLRQESKNGWVFPSIFGAGLYSRAQNLHLPDEVAEQLDREFWDEFKGVKQWQDDLLEFYERHQYVQTANGLRRYGPMSKNEIINMPIQGTAAVIVTEGMCALSELAETEDRPELAPMLNVHDDLTFEIPDNKLEASIKTIALEMCQPRFDWINVPLLVEVSMGTRWDNLEEVAKYHSHELFNIPNPYKELAHA